MRCKPKQTATYFFAASIFSPFLIARFSDNPFLSSKTIPLICDTDIFWRSRKRSGFPLQVLAESVGFPLQSLTCKCVFIYITFFFFIYSHPPVSGIGLSRLPVPLQALRQVACQKGNAKPGRTNGTHPSVLSPGASPAVETFRAPSRPNKFP